MTTVCGAAVGEKQYAAGFEHWGQVPLAALVEKFQIAGLAKCIMLGSVKVNEFLY
jgi:hypothetical protein